MTRQRVLIGAAVVAVLALVGAVAWFGPWGGGTDASGRGGLDDGDPAAVAAREFAAAWADGTLSAVTFAEGSGDVAATSALITARLTPDGSPHPTVEVTEVRRNEADDSRATATATVTWDLGDDRVWSYPTRFPLVEQDGTWLVAWLPAVVEPSLGPGEVLRATRVAGARGQILDTTGRALVAADRSVVVGIQRSRTTDPTATARTVAQITGVDAEELVARVDRAGPEEFVEVLTLPRPAYDAIRDEVHPLPGTVFREEEEPTGLPQDYARAVLGTAGPASAETAAASDGRVAEGEITGTSGLQASQDEVLAGRPGLNVQAVPDEEGATPRALKTFPATDGSSVTVTLDQEVQTVADRVLADTETPSALVVVRVSTGDVLAVANGPSGSSAYNRAMIGRYPPGSVFKVASTLALLESGLTADDVVPCPETITVGKVFTNADGFALGDVPFRTNFARSCNTAFVGRATTVTPDELAAAAASLGYRDLDLGAPAVAGSVPTDGDATEHAAQVIGQGRVEASPLVVAVASASVASGTTVIPRLVVDPDDPAPEPGPALPPDAVAELRALMRLVVTEGTGTALAGVPGGEVFGKTGTAEYGTESPPRTHAWFTGYQGDLAFAVLVEDGDAGGTVAAPIAAELLTILAGGG